jgi:hypothetical protein
LNTKTCWLIAIELAVIVAWLFAGAVAGGVYTALVFGEVASGLSVPQAGEQPVFATESVHVTPLLPGSPDTLAVSVTGALPASTKGNVLLTETTTPGDIALEEDPHPEFSKLTKIAKNGSNKQRVAKSINHSPGFVKSTTAGVAQGNRRTIGYPCECGDTVSQMFRDSILAGR